MRSSGGKGVWGLGFELRKPERSKSVHGGSGGLVVWSCGVVVVVLTMQTML